MKLKTIQQEFKSRVLNNAPATEREAIYSNAYYLRLSEALEMDFADSFTKWGEDKTEKLIRKFISIGPSSFASLSEISEAFVLFLGSEDLISNIESENLKIQLAKFLVDNTIVPTSDAVIDPLSVQLMRNPSVRFVADKVIWQYEGDIYTEVFTDAEKAFLSSFDAPGTLLTIQDQVKSLAPEQIEAMMKKFIASGLLIIQQGESYEGTH